LSVTESDLETIFTTQDASGNMVTMEEAREGAGAFEGDMIVSEQQRQSFLELEHKARRGNPPPSYGAGTPWAGANMKYCFAPGTKQAAREATLSGMDQISKAVPCISFTDVRHQSGSQKCKQSPAVYIDSKDLGCFSYVGQVSSQDSQDLNLEVPGCDTVGVAIHEILHALGLVHEQSRPDRDQYINIHTDRISAAGKGQFVKDEKADTAREYDIMSVMHYSSKAFSKNDQNTIDVKDAGYALYTDNPDDFRKYPPGNRLGMTQLDADQLADFYRTVAGTCTSNQLAASSTCTDIEVNGQPWADVNGNNCKFYSQQEASGAIKDCSEFESSQYCCDCGGGVRFQEWSDGGGNGN